LLIFDQHFVFVYVSSSSAAVVTAGQPKRA
jgi:hypothetical protein